MRDAVGTSPSFCRRRSVIVAPKSDSIAGQHHQAGPRLRRSQRLKEKAQRREGKAQHLEEEAQRFKEKAQSAESQIRGTAQRQVCTRSNVCDWLSANISYGKTTKRQRELSTDQPNKRPRTTNKNRKRCADLESSQKPSQPPKKRTRLSTESLPQILGPEELGNRKGSSFVSGWIDNGLEWPKEFSMGNGTGSFVGGPNLGRKRSQPNLDGVTNSTD